MRPNTSITEGSLKDVVKVTYFTWKMVPQGPCKNYCTDFYYFILFILENQNFAKFPLIVFV
jgi:hypothetical protein